MNIPEGVDNQIANLQRPLLLTERYRFLSIPARFWVSDPEPHVTAIRSLTERPHERAVHRLVELLKDPSFPYRAEAAGALARTSDPRAMTALTETLGDADAELRRGSAKALGVMLQHEEFDRSRLTTPLRRLLALLASDPDAVVRHEAYQAIFLSADWDTQLEALDALSRDEHPLLNCAYLRSQTSLAQLSGETEVIDSTATLLRRRVSQQEPSYAAITLHRAYQLSKFSACGMPRVEAIRGLGILGQQQDLQILLGLMTDPEAAVREAAIEALSRLGGDAAFEAAITALKDPSLTVRTKAITILPGLSLQNGGAVVGQILLDGTTYERRTAAAALANTDGQSAALVAALEDPDPQVRHAASATLVARQESDSIPLLVSMLSAPTKSVRVAAMLVLSQYKGEASRQQLIAVMVAGATPGARLATIALGLRAESEARAVLEGMLTRAPSPELIAAIDALQDLGDPASIPILKAFLKHSQDAVARAAADLAVTVIEGARDKPAAEERTPPKNPRSTGLRSGLGALRDALLVSQPKAT